MGDLPIEKRSLLDLFGQQLNRGGFALYEIGRTNNYRITEIDF
jgi:hypothetical protein